MRLSHFEVVGEIGLAADQFHSRMCTCSGQGFYHVSPQGIAAFWVKGDWQSPKDRAGEIGNQRCTWIHQDG